MTKIVHLSALERALDYPYDAPDHAYLIKDSQVVDLDPGYNFASRIAVLSVGSNRAPVQLNRKFGESAELPVTPVRVYDCDVVHVANLAPYGAVPCSAFPCPGTHIDLNIVWLTPAQLIIMHQTESVGEAYDWVEWDLTCIQHQFDGPLERLFGYAAIAGAFGNRGKGPFGLKRIPAENRQFIVKTQRQIQNMIYRRYCKEKVSLESWIHQLQSDKILRDEVVSGLRSDAVLPSVMPWKPADLS